MNDECDKSKPWKPDRRVSCPACDGALFISSIIPINGQVNFACINDKCPVFGFVSKGECYFSNIYCPECKNELMDCVCMGDEE